MNVNQLEPNPSAGAPNGAPLPRLTSSAACGLPVDFWTAGRGETVDVPHVLRVQLLDITDQIRRELRAIAQEAARFCNALLEHQFAHALGCQAPDEESVYCRLKGTLSANVRDALTIEVQTVWRRHQAKILGGQKRLALFSADRALVAQGRRVRVLANGHGYQLSIRLRGEQHGPEHVFSLWWKPQVDEYVTSALQRISADPRCLRKVTFLFERTGRLDRTGRTVFALLTYSTEHHDSAT